MFKDMTFFVVPFAKITLLRFLQALQLALGHFGAAAELHLDSKLRAGIENNKTQGQI